MFSKELFTLLENTLEHSNNNFVHCTSDKLDYVTIFNQFVQEELTIVEPTTFTILNSFEISELLELFTLWKQKHTIKQQMNEETMMSLILHFYETIVIKNKKYVYGCCSKSWNKQQSVIEYLQQQNDISSLSITKLYERYCEDNTDKNSIFIVSKAYFEQTILLTDDSYTI